jgi:glycosyltransferase involved in cell wall biosynthesis
MRILWVRGAKIVPVRSGGQIRTFYHLRELARHHDVTVLDYYRAGKPDPKYAGALERELPGCRFMHASPIVVQRERRNPLRLLNPKPSVMTRLASAEVAQTVRQWLEEGRCDVAVCDALSSAVNFTGGGPTPSVLLAHNVETSLERSKAGQARNWLQRLVLRRATSRLEAYEARKLREFDHVVAVSAEDAAEIARLAGHGRVTAISTGVDLDEFAPAPPAEGPPLVVFVGMMSYFPNVEAVHWFCSEIWPQVVAAVPGARFRIVGRTPTPEVRALASDTVEVTGTVPSVAEHIAAASVVVVPLRAGGGTRLKIYQGMAMARATVSTTLGAGGLDVHDGQDIVLADGADAFAAAVIALLRDPGRSAAIGAAAAAQAAKYGWAAVSVEFEGILEGVVAGTKKRAGPQ